MNSWHLPRLLDVSCSFCSALPGTEWCKSFLCRAWFSELNRQQWSFNLFIVAKYSGVQCGQMYCTDKEWWLMVVESHQWWTYFVKVSIGHNRTAWLWTDNCGTLKEHKMKKVHKYHYHDTRLRPWHLRIKLFFILPQTLLCSTVVGQMPLNWQERLQYFTVCLLSVIFSWLDETVMFRVLMKRSETKWSTLTCQQLANFHSKI